MTFITLAFPPRESGSLSLSAALHQMKNLCPPGPTLLPFLFQGPNWRQKLREEGRVVNRERVDQPQKMLLASGAQRERPLMK